MKKKKVYLAHNSCLNASYDFNLLKAGLSQGNFEVVTQLGEADEIIFSGCSVREIWVDDALNQIEAMHEIVPSAQITVTGCAANTSVERIKSLSTVNGLAFKPHDQILKDYTGLELQALDKSISQSNSLDFEGQADNGLSNLRRRVGPDKAAAVGLLQEIDREYGTQLESLYRKTTKGFVFYNESVAVEFITVTRSCPYKCAFCNIPRARGEFTSVALEDIVEKARAALERGVRHFTLVGDEIGNYGAGASGPKFSDMITTILNLDPDIRLSIRYIEPKPLMRNGQLLRRLCEEGRIELLYVSLQSGSQSVLNGMRRNYNITKIAQLYAELRNQTDTVFYCNWMVGFPSETEEDFYKTVSLVKQLNLHINIAVPFSSRPDTPAESFDDHVGDEIKASRMKRLTAIIADLKVETFRSKLAFLSESRLRPLLDKIRDGELLQYEDLQAKTIMKIHNN